MTISAIPSWKGANPEYISTTSPQLLRTSLTLSNFETLLSLSLVANTHAALLMVAQNVLHSPSHNNDTGHVFESWLVCILAEHIQLIHKPLL